MLVLLLFCFGLTFAGLGAVALAFILSLPSDEEDNERRRLEEGFCFHDY
jgi:hypothetical protein